MKDLPEEFIKELENSCKQFQNDIYWDNVSSKYKLPEIFIKKYQDKVDWHWISVYQKLSEEFINEFQDKVDWFYISKYQKLSEEFIERLLYKFDWDCISIYQKLSESFIEKFQDRVEWYCISKFQKLSESFIEKYQDKVNWSCVSTYQKLSESFIEKFQDIVDWYCISRYQNLSNEFINEYNLCIQESSWMYKDKEWKRKYIQDNTEYEIIGDKVIAYKSCRSDGYSKFNFQYHYSVENEYESHANYNSDEENSFGLSAWTKEEALNYCDDKLFKAEIDLDDVACIVHGGGKIRATKIKIVEEIII